MTRHSWFRLLRGVIPGLAVLFAGCVAFGLFALNHFGLNDQMRFAIEEQLADHGVPVRIGKLRVNVFSGLVAEEVEVLNPEKLDGPPVAQLKHLIVNADLSMLLFGKLAIRRIKLVDSSVKFPVSETPVQARLVQRKDKTKKSSEAMPSPPVPITENLFLEIEHFGATISIPEPGCYEISNARGELQGIEVEIDALLRSSPESETKPPTMLTIRPFIERFVHAITQYSWPKKSPPKLKVKLDGELADTQKIETDLQFEAKELTRNNHKIYDVFLEGNLKQSFLVIDFFQLHDKKGSLELSGSLSLEKRLLLLNIDSDIDLPRFTERVVGQTLPQDLVFEEAPELQAEAEVFFAEGWYRAPSVKVFGKLSAKSCLLRGVPFEKLTTDFSWKDGNFFLEGLRIQHAEGKLVGDLAGNIDSDLKFRTKTNIPFPVFQPIAKHEELDWLVKIAKISEKSSCYLDAEGRLSIKDLSDFEISGKFDVGPLFFEKVPLLQATSGFQLRTGMILFEKPKIVFNYSDYDLLKKTGVSPAPTQGTVSAQVVVNQFRENFIEIKNLEATAYPAPCIRMFDSELADSLEMFRFHDLPQIAGNGVIATSSNSSKKTDIVFEFSHSEQMDYEFLDKWLPLKNVGTDLKINGSQLSAKNLKGNLFGGTIQGEIGLNFASSKLKYKGEFQYENIALEELTKIYEVDDTEPAKLHGSIQFSGIEGNLASLDATGKILLRDGNLLDIPIFGPLSTLLGVTLGKIPGIKSAMYSRISKADCSFIIKDGFWGTHDLEAYGGDLTFSGVGHIDLINKKMRMDLEMKTRGLFRFLTLPLRPFGGLFEFRGEGPLDNPSWFLTPFSNSPKEKKDPLFQKFPDQKPKTQPVPKKPSPFRKAFSAFSPQLMPTLQA